MSTHTLCFRAEIIKIMYTPVNPSFTIYKWSLRGTKLYRYVFVMHAFYTSDDLKHYTFWSCQEVFDALSFLFDNILIRFCTSLYQQIFGIPMDT